jgi:hypothetical protein
MTFDLEQALEILQRTPAILQAWLGGLSEGWSRNNYGPDTFSPFDVVGHLLHGEETDWMTRARLILEQGEKQPFAPFDRYAMYETSKGKTMADLLQAFATLRQQNLAALRSLRLTPEQLDLRGQHPALGQVTLRQLLATWVVHDLNHLHQIAKAMAFQYQKEVGPWREYLSILPRE